MKVIQPIAIVLAILLGLATVGLVGLAGFEHANEERIESLRAAGRLPAPLELHPAAPAIVAELERLSSELESTLGMHPRGRGLPPFVGGSWTEKHREDLERQVAAAEPVLGELDALLASDEVRAVLAADAYVVGVEERIYAANLGGSRHWTNALTARAIVRSRHGDHDGAAESLLRALDLQRLVDHGYSWGFILDCSMTGIVMQGACRILEEDPRAAHELHAALEPRLKDHGSLAKARRRFAGDVGRVLERTHAERAHPWDVVPWERVTLARIVDGALDELDASAVWVPHPAPREKTAYPYVPFESFARTSQDASRRAAVFRVALALLAHRERTGSWPARLSALAPDFRGPDGNGRVPVDPVTGTPLHYSVEADTVVLAPEDLVDTIEESQPLWYRGTFVWRADRDR